MALILSTDNYNTVRFLRFIKYIFYSLTLGDIWIQFIARFIYFEILMNYLHTSVHISEFSKKYVFYSLTFGDIWIHFIAHFIYFEILMNYLHTNVHISEFSKKCVYFKPYFLGDLAFMRIMFFHLHL